MEHRISTTELIEKLRDVLERIRDDGDSFVVERNGDPVARLIPVSSGSGSSLRASLAAWRAAGDAEPAFADDLERIGSADLPPENAWAS